MTRILISLILSFVLIGSVSATNCDMGYPYPIDNTLQAGYYMDGNGQVQPYQTDTHQSYDRQFKDWTYIDENGYDYTIQIEVK